MRFGKRLRNTWNAFLGRDPTRSYDIGYSTYTQQPYRRRMGSGNVRTIINSIYNQIAVDVSSIDINHVRLDDEGRFMETIDDELNQRLTVSANLDQTGRELIRDAVMTMFDKGVVAIVPVDTNIDPEFSESFKINELRAGEIVEWRPREVRVSLYNEFTGQKEDLVVSKKYTAIIENPFYSIMNEPNSTSKRLTRVLSQMDLFNDELCRNKLDLIIQLPYNLKSEAKRAEAEKRRKDIEVQLRSSQYGIAYAESTERIIQLNRSLENNLWTQVKDLTTQLYNQLGFSENVFNGTATEQEMLNYNNRVVIPTMVAIVEEMHRKFLSTTARTQKQAVLFFRDVFKFVPVNQMAEIGDKYTRNEIMTSNEVRQVIGMKPSQDPRADELRNSNLNHPEDTSGGGYEEEY